MLPISNKGTQSYVYLKMWSGEVIVYDLSISGEHNWKSLASSTSGVCGRDRSLAFHGQPCFCQWHDRSEYMVTANYRYGSAWLFIRFNTNTPRLALNSSDKSWSHVVVLNETKNVWKSEKIPGQLCLPHILCHQTERIIHMLKSLLKLY